MTADQYEAEAADYLIANAQNLAMTYTEPEDHDAATIALLMAALERLTTRPTLARMMEAL